MRRQRETDPRERVINALFAAIPDPVESWPLAQREKWLRFAAAALALVYDDDAPNVGVSEAKGDARVVVTIEELDDE